jgi:2-amino-4-hydroxy-6-hydroxymethyldihydropteridine diphosphokinase
VIAIALGANLPSKVGSPLETLQSVIRQFPEFDIRVKGVSHWYETTPVPASDQPLYVNGVASVETKANPETLLNILQSIEDSHGRARRELNAARTLDLDILDFEGRIEVGPPILPHPRLENRAFVLIPLRDIAPKWQHPVSGLGIDTLVSNLADLGEIRRIG